MRAAASAAAAAAAAVAAAAASEVSSVDVDSTTPAVPPPPAAAAGAVRKSSGITPRRQPIVTPICRRAADGGAAAGAALINLVKGVAHHYAGRLAAGPMSKAWPAESALCGECFMQRRVLYPAVPDSEPRQRGPSKAGNLIARFQLQIRQTDPTILLIVWAVRA